jgi:hypothetical protein
MITLNLKDMKEIAKGGGLLVSAVLLVYLCGNEYFLSIFHDGNVGMYLVVPPEVAINEGTNALLAVVAVTASAGTVGYSIGLHVSHTIRRLVMISMTMLAAVVMGYYLPDIAHVAGLSVQFSSKIPLAALRRLNFAAAFTTGICCWLAYRKGIAKRVVDTPKSLVIGDLPAGRKSFADAALGLAYVLAAVSLIYSAFVFSSLRGKSVILKLEQRSQAMLLFTDAKMQDQFDKIRFRPLFETSTDLVLVYITDDGKRKIVVIKKTLISSVVFQ